MQLPEKNIKGITLLEILVVIAIIGVISGFSYPSISDWRSTRIIKDEVQKTASLFQLEHKDMILFESVY